MIKRINSKKQNMKQPAKERTPKTNAPTQRRPTTLSRQSTSPKTKPSNPYWDKKTDTHFNSKKETVKNSKRSPKIQTTSRPRDNTYRQKKAPEELNIPPVGENIRIIPLGGVEEVGKNMIAVETNEDIIIFDVGFQFEEEDTPGVDYILPNTKYLEEKKDKIKAVIITHGHLDHIGGIPYIMEKIGNPPIYTRNLTSLMIKKRQAEFPNLAELDIRIVEPGEQITIGSLPVEFFPVTHSIPDAMCTLVKTKHGNVVVTGDLKLDHIDGEPTEKEKKTWDAIGKQNNLILIIDSTNVENPGFSIREKAIHKNLEEIIKNINGRIIVGTFASQFERMIELVAIASKYNKKIVTEGRSIKTNIEIAKTAGLLKVGKENIIPAQDIDKYPADRIFILATGAQGEEFAALMRMSMKKHKYIHLKESDTIILSSSIIPGNEVSVRKLKDNLYRHDVKIIHYKVSDVHSTGHGNAEELLWVNKTVGAKFFMPAYGNHSMLRVHAQLVEERLKIPRNNIIVPDNGSLVEITDNGQKIGILKEKAPSNIVMVDGFAIGDIQNVVIRDRQMLAQDGMFVVIVIVDLKTGKLRKSPDIISRGFVYLRESQELLREARFVIKKTVESTLVGMNPINFDDVKGKITDNVSRFLLKKTDKRPIVIPVMIGV